MLSVGLDYVEMLISFFTPFLNAFPLPHPRVVTQASVRQKQRRRQG